MRKSVLVVLAIGAICLQSCTKDFWKHHGHGHGHDDDDIIRVVVDEGLEDEGPNIIMSPNKLVISFDPSLSDPERQAIREEFSVTVTESCNCGDTNIERWTIDTDVLEIERAVSRLRGSSGGNDVEGDQDFEIVLPRVLGTFATANDFDPNEQEGIVNFVPGANDVNIAVIDTGLDYLNYDFGTDLLYGVPNSVCFDTFSGWNFTEGTDNVLDQHGHGTYVTKLTMSVLEDAGVGYNILPLKAFNGSGEGSLFNVICALGYVRDIQDKGGDINIVNASFGGAMLQEDIENHVVLNQILEDLKNKNVLVVASAGNKGIDNDAGTMGHFISGNSADNIFAVGGYDDTSGTIEVSSESNYGNKSIDVAVPFGGYGIELINASNEIVQATLNGTSYGAAYISGFAGNYSIMRGPVGVELKNEILDDGNFTDIEPGLDGKIKDNKAIIVN
ncbi:S8 family serine peptidase [Aurantibacter crassamenti]|uniref:S8 family peptidase n=1 Tax=Aurantibacter crassamenti TaxID=1837375 RepID=UPI0019399840|nr:S8 family serine peptidase [Aurantibacter crassamenti]MBM1105704.1 S8 family serine peptidase [Aurantibacter crassamenti]